MATVTSLEDAPRDRLALLLKHFSELEDTREPWRVMYPLSEVLLLVGLCHDRRLRRLRHRWQDRTAHAR